MGEIIDTSDGQANVIIEYDPLHSEVADQIFTLAHPTGNLASTTGEAFPTTFGFAKALRLDARTIALTIPESTIAALAKTDGIRRIYFNTVFDVPYVAPIGGAAEVENEDNWGIDYLRIRQLHALGLRGKGVKVGVLDTGIDLTHPALTTVALASFRAFDQSGNGTESEAFDTQWHGTHVCGILAGSDDGHLRGVAPEVELSVGQVLQGWRGSVASIKAGLMWMRDTVRPHVLNLSLGWPGLHDEWYPEIVDLVKAGTVVCVAAGNEFLDELKHRSPANYAIPGLISVGAISKSEQVWPSSGGGEFSWPAESVMAGAKVQLPTLGAPGEEVISSAAKGKYRLESGTSMACPHVAGVVAALISHPLIGQEGAVKILKTSMKDAGPPGFDIRFGRGLLSGSELIEAVTKAVSP